MADGAPHALNSQLHGYFLAGAGAYLTQNVAVGRGLANGTHVTMASITMPPEMGDEDVAALGYAIAAAAAGAVIMLACPPLTINVLVPGDVAAWGAGASLSTDTIIVPISASTADDVVAYYRTAAVKLEVKAHALEHDAAITIHKAQGAYAGAGDCRLAEAAHAAKHQL